MGMQSSAALNRTCANYAQLRQKWIADLRGDHPNAVWIQLDHLVRTEVWFKAVVHLRNIAGNPPVNAYLWEAFTTGYGLRQSLGIRRLTDLKKGTASLHRIVRDIKRNQHFLSRRIVVGHDGTPMDLQPLWNNVVQSTSKSEICSAPNPADPIATHAWSRADHAHKAFDRLRQGPLEAPQLPDDRIDTAVLNQLEEALTAEAVRRVRTQCDKYLAHADLGDLGGNLKGPTYTDLHNCVATLVEVNQFLRSTLLNHSSSSVVATPQFDHLANLASPLVPSLPQSQCREAWDNAAAEVEEYGNPDRFMRFAVHPF